MDYEFIAKGFMPRVQASVQGDLQKTLNSFFRHYHLTHKLRVMFYRTERGGNGTKLIKFLPTHPSPVNPVGLPVSVFGHRGNQGIVSVLEGIDIADDELRRIIEAGPYDSKSKAVAVPAPQAVSSLVVQETQGVTGDDSSNGLHIEEGVQVPSLTWNPAPINTKQVPVPLTTAKVQVPPKKGNEAISKETVQPDKRTPPDDTSGGSHRFAKLLREVESGKMSQERLLSIKEFLSYVVIFMWEVSWEVSEDKKIQPTFLIDAAALRKVVIAYDRIFPTKIGPSLFRVANFYKVINCFATRVEDTGQKFAPLLFDNKAIFEFVGEETLVIRLANLFNERLAALQQEAVTLQPSVLKITKVTSAPKSTKHVKKIKAAKKPVKDVSKPRPSDQSDAAVEPAPSSPFWKKVQEAKQAVLDAQRGEKEAFDLLTEAKQALLVAEKSHDDAVALTRRVSANLITIFTGDSIP